MGPGQIGAAGAGPDGCQEMLPERGVMLLNLLHGRLDPFGDGQTGALGVASGFLPVDDGGAERPAMYVLTGPTQEMRKVAQALRVTQPTHQSAVGDGPILPLEEEDVSRTGTSRYRYGNDPVRRHGCRAHMRSLPVSRIILAVTASIFSPLCSITGRDEARDNCAVGGDDSFRMLDL